ncbi:hypothetical protein PG990_013750 [Apiospora arundinis]
MRMTSRWRSWMMVRNPSDTGTYLRLLEGAADVELGLVSLNHAAEAHRKGNEDLSAPNPGILAQDMDEVTIVVSLGLLNLVGDLGEQGAEVHGVGTKEARRLLRYVSDSLSTPYRYHGDTPNTYKHANFLGGAASLALLAATGRGARAVVNTGDLRRSARRLVLVRKRRDAGVAGILYLLRHAARVLLEHATAASRGLSGGTGSGRHREVVADVSMGYR